MAASKKTTGRKTTGRKTTGRKTPRRKTMTRRKKTASRKSSATKGKDHVNALIAFYQPNDVQRKELHRLATNFRRFVKIVRNESQLVNVHVKTSYKRTAEFLLNELERIRNQR
jgi:hypothetical protein